MAPSRTDRKRKRSKEEDEDSLLPQPPKTPKKETTKRTYRKRKRNNTTHPEPGLRRKKPKLCPLPNLSTELHLLIHSFADVPEKRKMEKIMGWESPLGMGRVAVPDIDLWEVKRGHVSRSGQRAILPLPMGKSYILSFPPPEEVFVWQKTYVFKECPGKDEDSGKRRGKGRGKRQGKWQVHWVLDTASLLERIDEQHSLDYSMFVCPPTSRQYAVSLHMVIMTVNVKKGQMDEHVEIYDQDNDLNEPEIPTKYRGKLDTLNMKRIYRQPRRKCVKNSC